MDRIFSEMKKIHCGAANYLSGGDFHFPLDIVLRSYPQWFAGAYL